MRSGMLKAKCSMQLNPLRSFFSAAINRWPLVVGRWPEYRNHGDTGSTEEHKEEKV